MCLLPASVKSTAFKIKPQRLCTLSAPVPARLTVRAALFARGRALVTPLRPEVGGDPPSRALCWGLQAAQVSLSHARAGLSLWSAVSVGSAPGVGVPAEEHRHRGPGPRAPWEVPLPPACTSWSAQRCPRGHPPPGQVKRLRACFCPCFHVAVTGHVPCGRPSWWLGTHSAAEPAPAVLPAGLDGSGLR